MDGKCPLGEHSKMEALWLKVCTELLEIKKTEEKQWDIIAKKASVSAIKWGVVIFMMLMMATVAFLWNNQREVKNEIVGEIKSINGLITGEDGLRDKVKALGWKLDGHLEKGNGEPKK